jgi:hypothetical protein
MFHILGGAEKFVGAAAFSSSKKVVIFPKE